ncbi:nickel ABC transporter permease [Kurthia massiliensis]|uniref:nickel ABC transporter permease n=1 Tax=Kurthia massiliensis TaxID=1033739 RepID=UPI00028A1497|nr:nickel ABC transporter permease [Kurthia massiliensis]
MFKFIAKRILQMIPILIVVTIVVFMFVHLIPGNPARIVAGPEADQATVERIEAKLGLDKPIVEQYFVYVGNLVKGDFGNSLKTNEPILEEMKTRFMPTFWLTVWSMIFAFVVGIGIGILSAMRRNSFWDYFGMFAAVVGISIPSFWLGLILMQWFSVQLGWFPTTGLDSWKGYVLPSITLGVGVAAIIARFTRSALIDVLKEDYIRTGRAKGFSEWKIMMRQALKNAMVPVVTMTGLQFGFLLGGSVVIETVFGFPGLGSWLIDAVTNRDYPVIQAEILLFSLEFLLINLAVDVIYGFLNPQIRYDD